MNGSGRFLRNLVSSTAFFNALTKDYVCWPIWFGALDLLDRLTGAHRASTMMCPMIWNRTIGEGSSGKKPMEAGEIRDESMLLHQPDAPLIEWLDQRLQGRPRSIHQALFKWDPEMFCRHQFDFDRVLWRRSSV